MKQKIFIGSLAFGTIFFTGCEQLPLQNAPNPPVIQNEKQTNDVGEKGISRETSSVTTREVRLSGKGFLGEISLSSGKIETLENIFRIPVYLSNVTKDDIIDTVTLKSILPEGVRLQEVITPMGYTAELDGIEGNEPVVYYHPFSITADSYEPVVSHSEPIFTLVFSGSFQKPIAFEGSFFQTTGTLIRTNQQTLSP